MAEWRGRWLALAGWQGGAYKCRPRDRWVGWGLERQFERLGLVANNTRLLVMAAPGALPNLASFFLSAMTRRLCADWLAAHGRWRRTASASAAPTATATRAARAPRDRRHDAPSAHGQPPGGAAGRPRRPAPRAARPEGGRDAERRGEVFLITSLSAERASPAELLALNRGHWAVENANHRVRDTALGEDACLARTGNGPINRASLNNIAFAVVFANRRDGESLAAAFRGFQLDTADAIRALRDPHRPPPSD